MEKFNFVVPSVLILVALLSLNAVVAHEGNPAFQECKVSEKATDEDLATMRDPNQPKTKPAKCMFACLGEKSGKIVNNKLSPDGVTNWFKNSPNYTEQLQQSVNEIVAECKDVTDPDRCEAGVKIMDCMMQGAMKRGIKPPFHGPKKP